MEKRVYSEVIVYGLFNYWFYIHSIAVICSYHCFRWIRFIYQNSEKQVEQNEKIIELLMEIKEQNEKESK